MEAKIGGKDHLTDYDLRVFSGIFFGAKKSSKPGVPPDTFHWNPGCLIHRDPGIRFMIL